jgi:hypothetical protein
VSVLMTCEGRLACEFPLAGWMWTSVWSCASMYAPMSGQGTRIRKGLDGISRERLRMQNYIPFGKPRSHEAYLPCGYACGLSGQIVE